MGPFPLYKGATRAAVVLGVPVLPLVALFTGVAVLTLFLGLWFWGLLLPGWLLMAQVTRTDDRAFRILGLWAQTKLANRLRLVARLGIRDLWGASAYATSERRFRSWEGRDSRWAG